jgi:hypothetical protein
MHVLGALLSAPPQAWGLRCGSKAALTSGATVSIASAGRVGGGAAEVHARGGRGRTLVQEERGCRERRVKNGRQRASPALVPCVSGPSGQGRVTVRGSWGQRSGAREHENSDSERVRGLRDHPGSRQAQPSTQKAILKYKEVAAGLPKGEMRPRQPQQHTAVGGGRHIPSKLTKWGQGHRGGRRRGAPGATAGLCALTCPRTRCKPHLPPAASAACVAGPA